MTTEIAEQMGFKECIGIYKSDDYLLLFRSNGNVLVARNEGKIENEAIAIVRYRDELEKLLTHGNKQKFIRSQ